MSIIVKPISAQLVSDADFFGKGDPYCVITVGSQKQKSKVCNGGGKNPQWFDTLQFSGQGQTLTVQVFDSETFKDELIGQGTVNLAPVYSKPGINDNDYVNLMHHGKSAGRLLLSIEYQGQAIGGNQGYGQQQGWGSNQPQQGQGWGNQPQQGQGWGNQPQQGQGWGNQPQQGQGWGNQPQQGQGWGNQPQQGQGWGNQPPQNQGWGNNQGQGQQGWGNNNNGW